MRSLPIPSKACSPIIALLFILAIVAIQPAYAQDHVGGASRTDLSGGSSKTSTTRPKVSSTSTTEIRKVTRTKTIAVTATTGTLAVASVSGAAILVEPLAGGDALEATVEKDEGLFIFNDLKPGRYRVATELDGYTAAEKEVTVIANRATSVTLNIQPIPFTVTLTTNVQKGEVRYEAVDGVRDPSTGQYIYSSTGEKRIVSIVDGRAVLANLRHGTYAIDIRAEEIGYKTLLATFRLPGKSSFDIKLERLPKQAPTRILEQVVEVDKQTTAASGRYFALVIGNNNYTGMSKLKTAEEDAREVAALLGKRYGFETKLLLNANRQKIIGALVEYRKTLGANDSLLIYYAGHGYRDADAEQAYWLPVDASKDDNSNWISADDVTIGTKVIPAKHILIVSDSCYSGTLNRNTEPTLSNPVEREEYLRKMKKGKSRNLMASGGNEPVTDGGGGKHSIFAKALIIGLTETEKTVFTAMELFVEFIQQRVAGGSNQTPEYTRLKNSGHESGDFVFQRTP